MASGLYPVVVVLCTLSHCHYVITYKFSLFPLKDDAELIRERCPEISMTYYFHIFSIYPHHATCDQCHHLIRCRHSSGQTNAISKGLYPSLHKEVEISHEWLQARGIRVETGRSRTTHRWRQ